MKRDNLYTFCSAIIIKERGCVDSDLKNLEITLDVAYLLMNIMT
jgi:hypothetical protein